MLLITIFGLYASAQSAPARLDFNSYLQENNQYISKNKKPEKTQFAFDELKTRVPANQTNPDAKDFTYGVDKNGNISASSGQVWGSGGNSSSFGNSNFGNSSSSSGSAPVDASAAAAAAASTAAPAASSAPAESSSGGNQ